MSKKTVVAVDLDDVVTVFNKHFMLFHNRLFGTKVRFEDINDYRLHLVFGTNHPVLSARIDFFFQQHHHELELVDGAREGILQLKEKGCDLPIVTSRPGKFEQKVIDCLGFHLPDVFSDIHFANQFYEPGSAEKTKASICKRIGAIALIDDASHNAVEVSQSGTPVILLNNPWNQYRKEITAVTRVPDWSLVNQHIDELIYK